VVLAGTVDGLPEVCDVVVDHVGAAGEITVRWPKEGGRLLDVVAQGTTIELAERAARRLARFSDPDAGGGSASLPARVSHAELLGIGDDATPAAIAELWRTPASQIVTGLCENGIARIDLRRDGPHMAVIGGRGSGKTELLSATVLAVAATISPDRAHLVLWGESFGHLLRLPHVGSSLHRIDEAAMKTFADGIERELTRRERLRTQDPDAAENAPALIVVVDDIDTITRVVPAASDVFVRLLRRARGLGAHMIWSASRQHGGSIGDLLDLSQIRYVLRVASGPDSEDLIGTDAAARLERSLPGRGYLVAGRADPREVHAGAVSVGAPRPSDAIEVAPFTLSNGRSGYGPVVVGAPDERRLTALISAAGATAARPPDLFSPAANAAASLESPGLLELLGLHLDGGLERVTETWQRTDTESFLRVPIGVDTEMRPVTLDLRESALNGMGPHGLLVGATGSGKSELLRTLVCGLAVTHAPEALAFVLIDFKGGASFASLGALPHVGGVVTNLAGDLALVDRILAALHGEQRRRQELLAAAGNLANAREYRALREAGKLPPELDNQPLPELLVVVDEFAELLDTEPAFIDFFLTIGRVGRSLGIHLLLASQRLEEGKLRGLDTYLSYRLGLRTFSAIESRIVLGVPDAYSLPSAPGGGYLKVGSESFDRFQASYVSGPSADGSGSVLEQIIERLRDAAPRVHQIWLPPLPPALTLDEVFGYGFVHDPTRGFAAANWPRTGMLAVPIGVVDEPDRQRQLPLVMDFAGAHGALAIAGAPQSGKSMLLRTIAMSLAVTHTPEEVQIYGIDFGGGSLDALAPLPHVGSIASRMEPEKVRRVLESVVSLMNERESLFAANSIDSVAEFRRRRADGSLPGDVGGDVFVIIDGWMAFKERFEILESVVADIASRGLGYGVHLIVSMNRWLEMRPVVLDAIGARLELRLNAALDSVIDRRRAAVITAEQPGRGLHPSTLLFHTALPRLDGDATTDQVQPAMSVAIEHIVTRWQGWQAPEVKLLPAQIGVAEIDGDDGDETDGARHGVVVGVSEDGLGPWRFDLGGADSHAFIYGDGESGKTTLLRTWLTQLTRRTSPEHSQVVLIDYRRTLLEAVPDAHLRGYAASEPAAREHIDALVSELTTRLPGADVTAAQLRDRSWWSGPEMYVVVDDYDLVVTASGNPLSPIVSLLAQGRDIGLHVVLARRVAGASKMMFEPLTSRLREVSPIGVILSGDREEGPLIGSVRATQQPPGRGVAVTRRSAPKLIQVAQTSDALVGQ
jgi:DNA segregation ATPase FtsK/SpoIIIE, S-DNA-T family